VCEWFQPLLYLIQCGLCHVMSCECRQYLSVEDVTAILQHFKGEDIVSVPIGQEKMLDGIGV
jgi:hypothetical protein